MAPLLAKLTCLALALTAVSALSIEKDPVRVTHQNSGPRYDFDEVERTRLHPEANEVSSSSNNNGPSHQPALPAAGQPLDSAANDGPSVGHITVRRIFLVPMMPAQDKGEQMWPASSGQHDGQAPDHRPMFNGWPFFARPNYEQDSPANERPLRPETGLMAPAGEREDTPESLDRARDPMLSLLQTMLELMHRGPMSPANPNFFKDLAKDASSESEANKPAAGEGAEGRPTPPIVDKKAATNETNEDIVEIEGKKYLRKTIINRHVGENLIFMTKRLIFIPLNETDSTESTTMTSTSAPTTELAKDLTSTVVTDPSNRSVPNEEPKFATLTSTSTTTTEVPTTSAAAEQTTTTSTTTTTTSAPQTSTESFVAEETTTKKESLMDKFTDAINKAAGRIVEEAASTTTEKPTIA